MFPSLGRLLLWLRASALPTGDRGVATTVGVVLMVGLTVILVSIVGTFVFGFNFADVQPIADEILNGDDVINP